LIVNVCPLVFERCVDFAYKRISGSKKLYEYRGESRHFKMIEDVVIGTVGEWAVYQYLIDLGYEVSEPDMKLYKKNRKSFAADLYVDDILIHVKSQGLKSIKRYGHSWLMQKYDKAVSKPDELELMAFTAVNLLTLEVEILGFCWAKDLIFDECKVPMYRHTKVAIYLPQIQDRLFLK